MLSRHANVATDPRGNSLGNALVTITSFNGSPVAIYADRDGTIPIPGSIVTTDQYGNWGFFGAAGYYKAVVSKVGYLTVTLDDLLLPQVDESLTAAYFGIADNRNVSAGLMDWNGELVLRGGGQILVPPLYNAKIKDVLLHPSVSMAGIGRGATRLQVDDGANWGIKVLARARGSLESDGWFPFFEHFTIEGRRTFQSGNTVHTLWFEPIEADPDYGTYAEKGYCGGRVVDVEVTQSAGIGIYFQSGRKRVFVENTRCINGGSKGLMIMSNDPVVGQRCGFGGNDEHQLMFSACSGAIMAGVNCWGGDASRSNECLSTHFQNVNGGNVTGCVFNDTLSINQTTSDYRGITVQGNHFKPLEQYFEADGDPIGTGDASTNAYIRVRGAKNCVIGHNDYTRTVDGTRFKYILTVTDEAYCSATITASSDPDVQQWQTTDPVPILISGDSNCEYEFIDVFSGYRRTSARVVAGVPHNTAVPAGYDFVSGGTQPSLFTNRVHLNRGTALLTGTCQEFESMDAADSKLIATNRGRVTFYANADYAEIFLVRLPDFPDNGHELELMFQSGVKNLTIVVFDPDTQQLFGDIPTKVPPGTLLRFTFKPSSPQGQWWLVTSTRSDAEPSTTIVVPMINAGGVAMDNANVHVHLTRANTCTSYTVTLPPNPLQDEKRRINIHNAVTAWTLAPFGSHTLHTTDAWPTTIPAGGFEIECQFIGNVWYLLRAG